MPSPKENVLRHFRQKLAGGLGSVLVPEWGDENGTPMKIFFKSETNPRTQERLAKLFNDQKPIEASVEALIIRALDENGEALFKMSDKTELMNEADIDVIIRVIGEINNYQEIEVDSLGN